MDQVRYTPLMKEYLKKIRPLATQLECEDMTKTRRQLEAEASLMIETMQHILFINKYDDGDGLDAWLRRIVRHLRNIPRIKLSWWGFAPHLLYVTSPGWQGLLGELLLAFLKDIFWDDDLDEETNQLDQ